MRKKIVAGNWKMNKSLNDGIQLVEQIQSGLESLEDGHMVIVAPPFIHLTEVAKVLSGSSTVQLAAQNCHQEESGAYTGEVSAEMLASAGVQYVILGHSERRMYFSEDSPLLSQKVKIALAHELTPIFCCGEPLITREANQHFDLVEDCLVLLSCEME